MRIRSTKPEFWSSEDVAEMDLVVTYNGPFPTGPRPYAGLAPTSPDWEYVYLLFSEDDALLYVGRSWRPSDRFTKHRRKPWWPQVRGLVLVRVGEEPRWRLPSWRDCGPNTAHLERAAITELRPLYNIAGVAA